MAKLTALLLLLLLLGSAYALEFKEAPLAKYEEVTKGGATIRLEAEEYQNFIYPTYARHYYRITIKNDLALTKNIGSVGGKLDGYLKSGSEILNLQYYEYSGKTAKGAEYRDTPFKSLAIPAGETHEYLISVDTPPFSEGKFNFTLTLDGVTYFFDPTISACGALVAGTSYTLTQNLLNQSGVNCFTTGGAGVTLDGQGFLVDGIGGSQTAVCASANCGAVNGGSLIIKNIRLSDWNIGIRTDGTSISYTNVSLTNTSGYCGVQELTLLSNGGYIHNYICNSNFYGLLFYGGTGLTIANSTIYSAYDFIVTGTGLNATLNNVTTNATWIFPAYWNNNVTITNLTHSNYGALSAPANRTSDINYTDITSTQYGILIKAFNHHVPSIRVTFTNATIYNNSGVYKLQDRYWYFEDYRQYIGTSASMIIEENTNYYPAFIDLSQAYLAGSQFQILMLPKAATDISLITFFPQDELGNALPNVSISLFKKIGADYWLVSAKRSDVTGSVPFYLQFGYPYRLIVSATGYTTITTDYSPSTLTNVVIRLGRTGGGNVTLPNFEAVFNDVYYSLTPSSYYNVNWTLVNYTVFSNSSSLSYYGMYVVHYWNNTVTTVFNSTVFISPSGGSLTYNASAVGSYTVNIFFKHNNFTEFAPMARSFVVVNASTGGSLAQQQLATGFISGWAFYFVAIVVSMLAGGYALRFAPEAAGAVSLLVLWGFTYLYPWGVIVTLGTVGVTILYATVFSTLMVGAVYVLKWWG